MSIFSGSIKDVVQRIGTWIAQKKHTYICVTGAHGVVESQHNAHVMSAHQAAGLVVPDGMPLVWVGKAMGYRNTQRIYGPDLMLRICQMAQEKGWRVFLYGTTKELLKQLKKSLLRRYPKLKISGAHAPPFVALTEVENRAIVNRINRARPQVVFVGLSTPKQELWMRNVVGKLSANVLVGVGAAFDFIAGSKKQAPTWVRNLGFEWMFRLLQEPKRLGTRYLMSNSMFIFYCMREFTRSYLAIMLFMICVAIGIYGHDALGAIGVGGIFLFELLYLFRFMCFVMSKVSIRRIILCCITIAAGTYGVFFSFINNLELWVDEIQVIRFGQLPLGNIALEVMTKHVAVPPLDYWNMWIWNKVAAFVPVSVYEFFYRVPYMAMHTLTTILLLLVIWRMLSNKLRFVDVVSLCVGFLLYFFNPLPFVYSYEIRFYAATLLGAGVILFLYYNNKLYASRYTPLILLFCLNSVYHYIILVPFVLKGIVDNSSRKSALVLGACTLLVGLIVLPHLYIPNAVNAINAHKAVEGGLFWLSGMYFGEVWSKYAVYTILLVLLFFNRKTSIFLMITTALYVATIVALDMKYNYRYFGGKHFMFVIPFCVAIIYEFLSFSKNLALRVICMIIITMMWLLPFNKYIHALKNTEIVVAKSSVGLKRVFEYATKHKFSKIIFSHGDASAEEVLYNRIGIDWYADLYRAPVVVDSTKVDVCSEHAKSTRDIVYYFPNSKECSYREGDHREILFEGVMVVSDRQ